MSGPQNAAFSLSFITSPPPPSVARQAALFLCTSTSVAIISGLYFSGPGCRGLFFFGVFTMDTTDQKRYYSPQFSALSAISVRRLAWALGLSMPKAVDQMVGLLPSLFSPGVVCLACKDSTKCKLCTFGQQRNTAKDAALAV
jgi:hypothetical protein